MRADLEIMSGEGGCGENDWGWKMVEVRWEWERGDKVTDKAK